jgi:hypothetical protein
VCGTGGDAGLGEWEGAVWELCGWGKWEAGLLCLGGRNRILGEREFVGMLWVDVGNGGMEPVRRKMWTFVLCSFPFLFLCFV